MITVLSPIKAPRLIEAPPNLEGRYITKEIDKKVLLNYDYRIIPNKSTRLIEAPPNLEGRYITFVTVTDGSPNRSNIHVASVWALV